MPGAIEAAGLALLLRKRSQEKGILMADEAHILQLGAGGIEIKRYALADQAPIP